MKAFAALIATVLIVPAVAVVSQAPSGADNGGKHPKHVRPLPPGKEAHGAGPRQDVPRPGPQGPGPRPPVVGRAPHGRGPNAPSVAAGAAAAMGSTGISSPGGSSGGSTSNANDGALEQLSGFPGTGYTTKIPPDTQMAVGPTEVIEMVNSSAQMFTRAGVASPAVNSSTLFGAPDNAMTSPFYSDPRVVYDALDQRFFASILIFDNCNPKPPPTGTGCTTNKNSEVDLAVSSNSHPSNFTTDWTVYDVANDQNNVLYDQPKLGVNRDKVVMTWNEKGSIGPYQFAVFQKSDLLAAARVLRNHFFPLDTTHFNVIPVVTLPSITSTETEYAVNADQGSSTLTVTAFTGTPADNNVAMATTDFTIGSYSTPQRAVQPNNGPTLDTGVPAAQSAVWENNEIWAGGNDSCTPPGDNTARACLRLDTVSTASATPTLLQDVDLGQNGAYLSYPAVMVDTFGNFFVGHSVSSSSEYGTAGMSFAPAGNFPSTFAGIDYASGVGVYNNFDLNGLNRWGDYSGGGQDPNNPKDVWFAEELGSTSNTSQAPWGTQIGRFTQAPPAITSLNPISAPELSSTCAPTMSATGTDFVNGGTSINFGATPSPSVSVSTPEQLSAVAPAEPRGLVEVTATTAAGTSALTSNDAFVYRADTTAPTVTSSVAPPPNGAGWNNTSPTVTLTATDEPCGSGVQSITYSTSGAQTTPTTTVTGSSANFTITTEGVTTVSYSAEDNAGNVLSTQTLVVSLDRTAPTITITSPIAGTYQLGQVVNAGYSCSDALSGVAACTGPVPNGTPFDTSTLGSHTFTVNSSDVAGNTGAASVTYIVAYRICLLYNPDFPAKNSNSTIAIKLQICDANGNNLSSPSIGLTAAALTTSNGTVVQTLDTPFRYDPTLPGYIINISTKGLASGMYSVLFTISGADTTTHVAPFAVR